MPPLAAHVGESVCEWTDGCRTFRIHLDPDVAGRLSAKCWTARKAMPRHGIERSGFLVGRSESHVDAVEMWIEGFRPSNAGPMPLSAARTLDLAPLECAVARSDAGSIGIYCIASRSGHSPNRFSEADLLERCGCTAQRILLLIGPEPGTATIFRQGESGEGHTFPLSSFISQESPQGNQLRATRRAHIGDHEMSPVLTTLPVNVVLPPEFPRKTAVTLTVVLVLALLIAMTALALSYRNVRKLPPSGPQNLNLTVQGAGPVFRVFWNGNAPVLQHGSHGVLFIKDGDRHTYLDLSPAQLKAGSIAYETKASEPSFRLDVYSTEPDARGAVQVVKMPSAEVATARAALSASVPAPMAPVDPHRIAWPAVKSIYSPKQSVQSIPAETPRLPASSRPPSAPVPAPVAKPAEMEPAHSEPAASAVLTEAPAPASIAVAEKPTVESVSATPKPLPTQGPFVEVLPETVSGSRWEHIVGSVPVLRHFKKQEIIPPVPTYEENPLASVPDRHNITRSVFVDVKISVSEAGKVMFAEVSKYGEPPNLHLANAALSAAKRWVFRPARISNTPVSSEMVLHFHFVP